MAPNMAMPASRPVTAAERTIGLPNRPSGMTGSEARRSTRTNTPSSTPDRASNPAPEEWSQDSPAPASTSPTRNAEIAATKTAIPSTSKVPRGRTGASSRRPAVIAAAARNPNGRLM